MFKRGQHVGQFYGVVIKAFHVRGGEHGGTTSRKIAGSTPSGSLGFFIDYVSGVDSRF